jgi:hypothetical protein
MANRFNGQPAQAADIPALCLQYVGVEPTLVEQYDRLQVQMQDRVQSRIDANNAPDYQVKRYAAMMSESHFPAPLVTKDNIPVDGNTRFKAHALRSTRYIQCWQLPISWHDADNGTKRKLLLLSLALNAMNGLPLDDEERLKYASNLISDGSSDEEIVGKTGLALSKITSLRDQERASERLIHMGVAVKDQQGNKLFPETVLRAFGKPAAMRLDDGDFKEVFQLSKEAGLKGTAIASLATSINEAATPESRKERLARERQALQPQILALSHGHEHPMNTTRLRNALIMLCEKPITSFVEGNAEKAPEYVELIDKAIDKLTELRTLQISQPTIAAQARAAQTGRPAH